MFSITEVVPPFSKKIFRSTHLEKVKLQQKEITKEAVIRLSGGSAPVSTWAAVICIAL